MELELERAALPGYDLLTAVTLLTEQTQESIVPDACPDILRILDTRGQVTLQSKQAEEGRGEARGSVRAWVLYLPEDGSGPRRMEVTLPYTCTLEHREVSGESQLRAMPRLTLVEARLLNPRKVYLRVEVAVDWEVYAPGSTMVCQSCREGEEWGVQQRTQTLRRSTAVCVQEKNFTLSDTLPLPGGKPEPEELLCHSVELLSTERKRIGSKLVFKGRAEVRVLYRGVEGPLCTADVQLPFSQIMEVGGTEEECDCDLRLCLVESVCQQEEDGGLTISLDLLAQAVCWEEQSVEVLTDLYCTKGHGETGCSPLTYYARLEENQRRQMVRELLETPVAVENVVDCVLLYGPLTQSRRNETLELRADLRLRVLFYGEDRQLYLLARSMEAVCPLELEPGCRCLSTCWCPGELYATPAVSGLEVRFPVDFTYRSQGERQVTALTQAWVDPLEESGEEIPSLILRMVEGEEGLWDIAKAHATTMEAIARANGLGDEPPQRGSLLLIPKKG